MRSSLFLFFLLFGLNTFGQETVKVKNPVNEFFSEEYMVLKSDSNIKEGTFRKSFKKQLVISGHYNNGVADSIWKYYDYRGEVSSLYDYTNHKLLYSNFNKKEREKKYRVLIGTTIIDTLLDQPPLYMGNLFEFLAKTIEYPMEAKEHNLQGQVMVQFVIYKDGRMGDVSVAESVAPSLDKEAVRVVSLFRNKWLPGLFNGAPANVIYSQPVVFRLE